jgi:hypothetical protein
MCGVLLMARILLKGVDTLSKYYSIHEFSKIIGVSAQTLRNWDANGKLHPHHTTVSGYRYYSDEQLNQIINVKPKKRSMPKFYQDKIQEG